MKEPLISIIVPVRNMVGTIGRTLDSIEQQRYSSVETIVVDGKSGDGTLEKVRTYESSLAAVRSDLDEGLYDAINKGLRIATGDIIAVLNGDDYYSHPDVLSQYARVFADSDVSLVFGDAEFFRACEPGTVVRRYSSRDFSAELLPRGWMPPHPTVLVRREVYDAIGGYSTRYRIAADFEFLLRALFVHRYPFDRIDDVVVRMQFGGLSTRGVSSTFQINREIAQACRHHEVPFSWPRLLTKFPKKLLEFNLLSSWRIG